jgi:hypothetical protein
VIVLERITFRRTYPRIVVVVFDIEGLLKALPFLFGEEIAKVAHADVGVLVGAD